LFGYIVEGVLSIFAGFMASSTSLLGFGLDSVVESFSGSIILWRFRKGKEISDDEVEKLEKKALKYIGYTFLILGFYVLFMNQQAKFILARFQIPYF